MFSNSSITKEGKVCLCKLQRNFKTAPADESPSNDEIFDFIDHIKCVANKLYSQLSLPQNNEMQLPFTKG